MSKITFAKPGNFIYPVPAVLVSCADKAGNNNIITIAWVGTICSDPPMAYISVRKERHSYGMIKEAGDFVINLPGEDLARALDYCGCTSGSKIDKFEKMNLTAEKSVKIKSPAIAEAPISIECKVKKIMPLGTHDMFIAEVVAVNVDDSYIDEKGTFHMDDVRLLAYSHGTYYSLGKKQGTFGWAVRKKKKAAAKNTAIISKKKAIDKEIKKNHKAVKIKMNKNHNHKNKK